MADIFISYSSKDREKAEQLTELLASAGLSVWIDNAALNAAASWSKEIVEAINGCKVFVVLLSPSSLDSHNVIKEVALASEKRKKILPLDLEPVSLTSDFEYQLAGIQRAPMTNIDAIIRALGKLGIEATGMPQAPKIVKESESRKSLMILPLEDLSPTGDNGWFTDGIASELVNSLSKVKSLRVIDWNTSSMLKNKKVRTTELAKDFSVRYFIEGQVRKFGDNIKISVSLLDIETGDHLWQDSLKGTMEDIFDIQEQVAEKVTDGLKLHLTKSEEAEIKKKPTENAEAYELYLKSQEYYSRHTRSDYERTLSLCEAAVGLDPKFATAYANIASVCLSIHRLYTRSVDLLDRAASAAEKVRKIEGGTAMYFWVMSRLALRRGDAESALVLALQATTKDPSYAPSYDVLGFAFQTLGRKQEAIEAWEEYVNLRENDPVSHFSLLIALNESSATDADEHLKGAAERAIPVFDRHIRHSPDDYNARVQFATVLQWASRETEALAEAEKLSQVQTLDSVALYNLACLYLHSGELEHGMQILLRAVEKGYGDLENLRRDPDLDPLRGRADFQEMMKKLEEENG
jgi:TolB-like protein/Flp pilus assembly protein TadD